MCGGGHKVAVGYWIGVETRADESCHMGDVGQEQRTNLLGDLSESGEVELPRVGRSTTDDHLRSVGERALTKGIVIDPAGGFVDSIGGDVVHLSREIHWTTVGEVAAVAEVHSQDAVPRLQHRHVRGHVGLGSAVGLYVDPLTAEQCFGAFTGKVLGGVYELTTAVVASVG